MFAITLLKLTLQEILREIPHDLPALVAYFILALFVAGIWLGSRSRPLEARPPTQEEEDPRS